MDEDEAAAALLALGGGLPWQQNWAVVKGGIYIVNTYRRKRFLWRQAAQWYKAGRVPLPEGEDNLSPRKYPEFDTAKAACERHYATGRWD